jgi:hypothetical protein
MYATTFQRQIGCSPSQEDRTTDNQQLVRRQSYVTQGTFEARDHGDISQCEPPDGAIIYEPCLCRSCAVVRLSFLTSSSLTDLVTSCRRSLGESAQGEQGHAFRLVLLCLVLRLKFGNTSQERIHGLFGSHTVHHNRLIFLPMTRIYGVLRTITLIVRHLTVGL